MPPLKQKTCFVNSLKVNKMDKALLLALISIGLAILLSAFAIIFAAVRCNGSRGGKYTPLPHDKGCIVVCSACGAWMHKREDKCHACGQKGTAKEFPKGEDD